jgi:hypothetical protein
VERRHQILSPLKGQPIVSPWCTGNRVTRGASLAIALLVIALLVIALLVIALLVIALLAIASLVIALL